MTLVRWQPRYGLRHWAPRRDVEEFHSDVGRLFDWVFGGRGDTDSYGSWMPAVDVYEDEKGFHVRADLPGMKREDIDVTLENNMLTISGEKKNESETKNENIYRAERYYGKFVRSVDLPSSVNTEKVEAKYKDGVLELMIPKSEEARPKQIKIES